jgi:hypothetical protein
MVAVVNELVLLVPHCLFGKWTPCWCALAAAVRPAMTASLLIICILDSLYAIVRNAAEWFDELGRLRRGGSGWARKAEINSAKQPNE